MTEAMGLTRTEGACHRTHGPLFSYKEMGWLPIQSPRGRNKGKKQKGRAETGTHSVRVARTMGWGQCKGAQAMFQSRAGDAA